MEGGRMQILPCSSRKQDHKRHCPAMQSTLSYRPLNHDNCTVPHDVYFREVWNNLATSLSCVASLATEGLIVPS